MIPEAREVHLSRKDRKVLEACCRSPVTLQRDLKRARIVLLAADGRSTRSIAKEVGVQPRIVSLWRHRYAALGLEGLSRQTRRAKVALSDPTVPLSTPTAMSLNRKLCHQCLSMCVQHFAAVVVASLLNQDRAKQKGDFIRRGRQRSPA